MFPFRKILFPVDYSEPCQAVVPYVKETVRHFSADLTLVHAYGGEALAHSRLPLTDPEVANEARAFEEQRIRDFAQETFPGQYLETFAELGAAGSVVHKIVQHQERISLCWPRRDKGLFVDFFLDRSPQRCCMTPAPPFGPAQARP